VLLNPVEVTFCILLELGKEALFAATIDHDLSELVCHGSLMSIDAYFVLLPAPGEFELCPLVRGALANGHVDGPGYRPRTP
jgi:hypothetical protein